MGSLYKIICCFVFIAPLLSSAAEYTNQAFESKKNFTNELLVDNQTLELITGLAKPPFILEDQQRGLQLDLIREAFASENLSVHFNAMPLGRNLTGFRRMNADGIITLPPSYEHPALFMSKPYIIYQNVAVSLAEDNFTIDKISDLSDKSIIAFQNAKKFLGEDYEGAIAYSMDYREVPDQMKQIELLFLRRTEVIILDINIFKYFVKTQKNALFNKPFSYHYIFQAGSRYKKKLCPFFYLV